MRPCLLFVALVLISGCSLVNEPTVYNPDNSGYYNFTEEPVHVFTERYDDGIAEENVFYVSANGSDAGMGNLDDPWRTIQAGVDRIRPGQKLYVTYDVARQFEGFTVIFLGRLCVAAMLEGDAQA